MELVATAQYRKAMDRAVAIDSYTQRLIALVRDLSLAEGSLQSTHPLLVPRKVQDKAVLLVLTANRGMCGGYNSSVMRLATARLKEMKESFKESHLEVSGKRGIGAFRFRKMQMDHEFIHFEGKPTFEQVDEIATRYYEDYIAGNIDRVEVVYQKFVSLSRQYPVVETILPLADSSTEGELGGLLGVEKPEEEKDASRQMSQAELKKAALMAQANKLTASKKASGLRDSNFQKGVGFEFLPSARSILDEVVPYAFRIKMYKCFLDAAVGEQIARMVAMKAATENADGIVSALNVAYNRARQSQITNEITEIIGGAAALEL